MKKDSVLRALLLLGGVGLAYKAVSFMQAAKGIELHGSITVTEGREKESRKGKRERKTDILAEDSEELPVEKAVAGGKRFADRRDRGEQGDKQQTPELLDIRFPCCSCILCTKDCDECAIVDSGEACVCSECTLLSTHKQIQPGFNSSGQTAGEMLSDIINNTDTQVTVDDSVIEKENKGNAEKVERAEKAVRAGTIVEMQLTDLDEKTNKSQKG